MNQRSKARAKRMAASAPDTRLTDEPAAPARRRARSPAGGQSEAAGPASLAADAKQSNPAGAVQSSEPARPTTKKARLIALLSADTGADVATMSRTLGWQAHTTRAALTGLRKAGHRIEASKQPGGGGNSIAFRGTGFQRRGMTGRSGAQEEVAREIARLFQFDRPACAELWRATFGAPAPKHISLLLMRKTLVYEV